MDLSLDNYYLHVCFNSIGGALSSIKDKDGLSISGRETRVIGAGRRRCFSQSAEA